MIRENVYSRKFCWNSRSRQNPPENIGSCKTVKWEQTPGTPPPIYLGWCPPFDDTVYGLTLAGVNCRENPTNTSVSLKSSTLYISPDGANESRLVNGYVCFSYIFSFLLLLTQFLLSLFFFLILAMVATRMQSHTEVSPPHALPLR